MKYKVLKKQNVGKMCFVCGTENDLGLKTDFYELENGELVGICKFKEGHQSFPGRGHGGVSAALLDETIGRAAAINNPDLWGVTIELSTKYRKPVPLEGEIKIVGRITKETYIKMPIEKIANFDTNEETSEEWFPNLKDTDPTEIEL